MKLEDLMPGGVLDAGGVKVYRDMAYRDPKCPREEQEQVTFFSRIRREYPGSYGLIALHPRNEGLKRGAQFHSVAKHKAEGMTPGAADIIIPGRKTFVCEMKRRDYRLCGWQDGQVPYLIAAAKAGAWSCVAFGCDAAWEAFLDWRAEMENMQE